MENYKENINSEFCKDVYEYIKDQVLIGKQNCFYHFRKEDYEKVSVKELHETMLFLYDRGFEVELDICAHLCISWANAVEGTALEFKKISTDADKKVSKAKKEFFKNHYIIVSSNDSYYENINKYFKNEREEWGSNYSLNYIKADDKEFLLVIDLDKQNL